ncbi:hypothetical protein HMPREF2532_00808 [Bacteroides ovatus]|nr:hypothetical protein HMPREF2532_00808 [Bacteroides ovatus]
MKVYDFQPLFYYFNRLIQRFYFTSSKVINTVNQEITQKPCQNRAKNTISIY